MGQILASLLQGKALDTYQHLAPTEARDLDCVKETPEMLHAQLKGIESLFVIVFFFLLLFYSFLFLRMKLLYDR